MSSCIYHKNQDKCSITRIPNVILLCASLTPDNQSCVDFQNFVTSEVLYKWNCTICNILWLNYFSAQQNSLKVHLNCWVSIKSSFCVIAKQYQCGLPWWHSSEESTRNAGDEGLIPVLGRSPGEGNGSLLQYSCLVNSRDRGAWLATVHGVTKDRTYTTERLHFHFSLSCIGEGNGNPLQCCCLENPRDGGAWWAAVYGVTRSQTRLKQLSSSSSNWTTATVLVYQHIFNHLPIEGHLTCFLFSDILNKIAINISYIISYKGSFYTYLEKVFKSIITLSYDNCMFSFL